MTKDELMREAHSQIALAGEDASCAIRIRGRWGKSTQRRIAKGGPIGTIVEECQDGRITLLVKANNILRWLEEAPHA